MIRLLDLERVYLNLGGDFWLEYHPIDLEKMLKWVGDAVKEHGGMPLFEDTEQGRHYFERRIKKCIAHEASAFVNGLDEVEADESAGSWVSITQINRMIRALKEGRRGRITCYAIIVFHVAYKMIHEAGKVEEDTREWFEECAQAVRGPVEKYYANHDDELALFLLKCYHIFEEELLNKDPELTTSEHFPLLPKRHPKDPLPE